MDGGPSDGAAPDLTLDAAAADVATTDIFEVGGPARTVMVTFDDQGQARMAVVHVPGGLSGPAALVLNLHGSGGTGASQEAFSGMDAAADAHGFIAAYPEGGIPLGGGFAWNVPGQPLSGGGSVPPGSADDSMFIAALVQRLQTMFSIDPKRVYATGMSGGGRMVSQLGCELSAVVAAVAPVAGLRFPQPCAGTRPVPVVSFHGTADTVNPYDGNGEGYWTYSVPTALAGWGDHDGCAATATVSDLAAGVHLTSYPGCAGGAAVQLYTIDGAGHEWPGGPQQTMAIDANEAMWSFFLAHPLP